MSKMSRVKSKFHYLVRRERLKIGEGVYFFRGLNNISNYEVLGLIL
jgi:hypothetical protein